MPFQIINEDIREVEAQAIVNPSNEYLLAFGGVDRLIHEAAGEKLDEICEKIGKIELSDAVMTSSFNLTNCDYIIHTCGPVYIDGKQNEKEDLRMCYENCLNLAKENSIESIAFPLISSGTYHFPKGEAVDIASQTIIDFLKDNEMDIYLLVYDKNEINTDKKIFKEVEELLRPQKQYTPKYSIGKPYESGSVFNKMESLFSKKKEDSDVSALMEDAYAEDETVEFSCAAMPQAPSPFDEDTSFGEYLIKIIDERNLKDSDVYKKANLSKSVFNDIKNDRHKPKKETICALCFGLRLDIDESLEMLDRGGFTLSRYMTFDKIVRHFLESENYNIFDINEVLYDYDCVTLGSKSH
ncbi:MAG: macro domain-containing protein [Erysipelotrichaceae bacterium]|nr:macro domain-containing protein [Erysipelotrichaceae bacterium]